MLPELWKTTARPESVTVAVQVTVCPVRFWMSEMMGHWPFCASVGAHCLKSCSGKGNTAPSALLMMYGLEIVTRIEEKKPPCIICYEDSSPPLNPLPLSMSLRKMCFQPNETCSAYSGPNHHDRPGQKTE